MKLLWTERALSDLDDILDFYEDVNPRAGVELCSGVMAAASQLEVFPDLGPRLREQIGPARYRALTHQTVRIIYQFDSHAQRVHVLRVWDGRRDPGRLEIIDIDSEG